MFIALQMLALSCIIYATNLEATTEHTVHFVRNSRWKIVYFGY